VEEIGLYLSTPVILVEQRQDFPTLLAVPLELLLHRRQKHFRSANAARQRIQPHESCPFAFAPSARLWPAGRLRSGVHVDILMSSVPWDLLTQDNTEDSW
jgi:hypothetical protein